MDRSGAAKEQAKVPPRARVSRSTLWKLLGVAGLAGVAATGVVVARDERRRQQLTPEQVRQRLQERHAGLGDGRPPSAG